MTGDRYIDSIDQGTMGTRFTVFDHRGQGVASVYERHEQPYPRPRWVEHDPLEIWGRTTSVVRSPGWAQTDERR